MSRTGRLAVLDNEIFLPRVPGRGDALLESESESSSESAPAEEEEDDDEDEGESLEMEASSCSSSDEEEEESFWRVGSLSASLLEEEDDEEIEGDDINAGDKKGRATVGYKRDGAMAWPLLSTSWMTFRFVRKRFELPELGEVNGFSDVRISRVGARGRLREEQDKVVVDIVGVQISDVRVLDVWDVGGWKTRSTTRPANGSGSDLWPGIQKPKKRISYSIVVRA